MANFEKEINYEAVLQALIEKTEDGKIQWQETADEKTFLAAVKGELTFEITLNTNVVRFDVEKQKAFPAGSLTILTANNPEGKLFFQTPKKLSLHADELYELARRIATRVDEKIDSTLELLNQL